MGAVQFGAIVSARDTVTAPRKMNTPPSCIVLCQEIPSIEEAHLSREPRKESVVELQVVLPSFIPCAAFSRYSMRSHTVVMNIITDNSCVVGACVGARRSFLQIRPLRSAV